MKKYLVKEIFGPTIQGEGKGTGEVVMFIRFSGCNKWSGRPEDKATSACPFCDTDFLGGMRMTAEEILRELSALDPDKKIRTVVISGGEPTLQLDAYLAEKIHGFGYSIYIETNGSKALDPSLLPWIKHISCSPKQAPIETKIQRIDSMKVLHPPVTPDRDIRNFITHPGMTLYDVDYFIQPVMDQNYDQNLKECLEICYQHPKVRLSVQIHKTIGVA